MKMLEYSDDTETWQLLPLQVPDTDNPQDYNYQIDFRLNFDALNIDAAPLRCEHTELVVFYSAIYAQKTHHVAAGKILRMRSGDW